MNSTLSPVSACSTNPMSSPGKAENLWTVTGLTPKLGQTIRAFEFTQIELAVYRDRGYAQGRGVGQPEADRCALACAFLAKAVLDLKTTRALMDRLQADSKLRRLCGFDLRFTAHTHQCPAGRYLLRIDGCSLSQHGDPRGHSSYGMRALD
jgi:hypothetical protein